MEPGRETSRTMTEIDPFSSATDMLAALRDGTISAVELLDKHLQRIERFNERLNALVTFNEEDARAAARMADEARSRGGESPLLGLPVTVKDTIFVRGLPATGGLQDREAAVQVDDARVVSHLRAAGAVLLGKTNVPPYASDWQSDNPVFGRSNNPWNLDYTPGGSTGGGAAAVAAGLSPLELGADFCGSIRIPAAFCGVYGHKPSASAVAGTGHFPGGLLPNVATTSIAVLGPLARHPDDLELALDAIAGPEVGEDRAWRLSLPEARAKRLADFRVAVLPPIPWQPVDDDIIANLEELMVRLAAAGVTVTEAQPDTFGDLRDLVHAYVAIISAISSLRLTPDERHWQAERCRALGDELLDAWADGLELSGQNYIELFDKREQYRAALRSFFDDWDVLVAPANIVNAFRHMDSPFPDRLMDEDCRLDVNGERVVYDRQNVYPSLASFTGHPATAFPVGLGKSGLPVGLQAIGPYLEDRTSIAFVRAVAREIGGYAPPPGYE
ncbi:MAG TPA: amidase family protein [Chloroflexota bacterium]